MQMSRRKQAHRSGSAEWEEGMSRHRARTRFAKSLLLQLWLLAHGLEGFFVLQLGCRCCPWKRTGTEHRKSRAWAKVTKED